MKSANVRELKPKELRFYPELAKYKGKTTKEIKPVSLFSFQKRGFEALDFGMDVTKKGFNIYVAGEAGSGKTSNVRKYIEDVAKHLPVPDDVLYVYNFEDYDSPNVLFMKAGSGEKFIKDMDELLDGFIEQIPRQMESENFEGLRAEVAQTYRDSMQKSYNELEAEAAKLDFALSSTENGLVLNPIVDGKPIDREKYESLDDKEKEKIRKNESALQEKLIAYFHQDRKTEKEYKEQMIELQQTTVKKIISEPLNDLAKKYGKNEGVNEYLNSIAEFTVNNFNDFFTYRDFLEGKADPMKTMIPDFKEYKVNLLINNKDLKGAPVIYETNPTFQNIIGYFEYEESHNSLFTDFTRLKPGALHRANGGFLIIQADDILKNYYAWTALKRAVRNRFIKIEDMDADFKYRVISAPNPEPVPLEIKVVLIGDEEIYHLLYERDPDFRRIFKVKADFESIVDVNASTTDTLIGFISRIVNEDCELPFDLSAIRRLLFYSSRRAEDQSKYRVHASDIVEIIVEAVYWAQHKNKKVVSEDMVITAIESREKRYDRFREHYFESIKKGTIHV